MTIRIPDSISKGSHTRPDEGMCVMETVAFIAGEPHSDKPQCACPVITEAAIIINDRMPDDATRTRILGPLAFRIAGTRSTREVERERAYIAADWACRVFAPLGLDAAFPETARNLRALPRIVDKESAEKARAYAAAAANANAAAAYAAYAAANAAYAAANAASARYAVVWELAGKMLAAMIDLDHAAADEELRADRILSGVE